MNESPSPSSSNGEDIPPWMKSVSKDSLYDVKDEEVSEKTPPKHPSTAEEATSSPENLSATASSSGNSSSLRRELALSMEDPSDIPTPDPDLQPTAVGSVRADLARQLKKALAVLQSRYETEISQSLLLEFALQRTLRSLREDGDESELVQWLDSELPLL